MPSLEDLGPKTLAEIAEATETVYQRRAYLPGRVLLAMVWHFRNDVRAQRRYGRESYPGQPEPLPLARLITDELDALLAAVGVMTDSKFTPYMEDPELPTRLSEFGVKLKAELAERAELQVRL
jgi:hypothetical protein